jgi:hypothetical protein
MKKTIFALALLIAAAPLMASVTFGTSTVSAGSSWTESSQYGSSLDIAVDTGMGVDTTKNLKPDSQQHQETNIQRTKTITVTQVQGQRISGFTVTYASVNINGTDLSSMFASKTYLIDINGNHVNSVTYGDSSAVPAQELAFVQSDNSNIAQVRAMADTLGGATVDINGVLKAKNLDDLFDVQSGFTVDSYSMTLTEVNGDNATFSVSLEISGDVKKGKGAGQSDPAPFSTSGLHLSLAGTLHAEVSTGRVLDFSLQGTPTASGQKEAHGKDKQGNDVVGKKGDGSQSRSMSITVTGTASLAASFSY